MKRIKRSSIFLTGVFIYIIFQMAISIIGKNVKLQTVHNEEYEAKIESRGLVIRKEYIVKSSEKGNIDLLVKEGEKVKQSQNIATIYKNKSSKDLEDKAEVLSEEIDKLKTGKDNISKNDIVKLDNDIEKFSKEIQEELLNKNYNAVSEKKESIVEAVNQRNKLISNGVDSKKLETKEVQKQIIDNNIKNNLLTMKSSFSGLVSYKLDGNEELYNIGKIENITKEDISKATNSYETIKIKESVKKEEPIVRIIDDSSIYILVNANKENREKYEINASIIIKYNNNEFSARVDKIYKQGDDSIIVMKISNPNNSIFDTRIEEFDIIYKQIEGLKVNKKSIKVVDNKKGVYIVDEEINKAKFVQLNSIIYENEEFVFIDNYKNKLKGTKSLTTNDRIILNPNIINKNIKIE